MHLLRQRVLRGPNPWTNRPVLELLVDVRCCSAWQTPQFRELRDATGHYVPGFSVKDEVAPVELLGRLTLHYQTAVGGEVAWVAHRPPSSEHEQLVAIEYDMEPVGLAASDLALRTLRQVLPLVDPTQPTSDVVALAEEMERLQALADANDLNASTWEIYRGARALGIPVVRLSSEYGRYLQIGQGSKQARALASETDNVSGVARSASTDKFLTKQLLHNVGVPVPAGRLVHDAEDAWVAACELGVPVAIKPLDCDLGFGVTLDVRTRERAAEAYRLASDNSSYVLVEKFAPGIEHRVLVTGDTIAAVSRIEPPHVVGDDRSTIRQLVDRINADPRRGEHGPLYPIKLDESAAAALALQGHSFQTVPREGERVLTRRNPPYIKHGGSITDWTDRIHPTVVGHALAAARALKLPVAGLDVVATDISQPLEEQGGVVVEVNAGPGLWLHMEPWADSPLPVGQSIVRTLFPEGESGRIPILAVLGSTAALGPLLAERLNRHSIRLGQLENGTIHAGKRRWPAPGATPQERAQALLQNTQIDAALIQTTGPELVEAGFACDRCDVVLVLESHSNADLFEESLRALLHALVPSGRLIVKAGVLVQQLQLLYQERITFFSPSTTESEIADLVVGLVCPNP